LQRLLAAWQVVVIDDGRGGYDHNAALLVIDQRGRLVRIFDDNDVAGALDFARALQRAGSVM
jgi:protein SCO1